MSNGADTRDVILAHGGDIRSEAPVVLILSRLLPKDFDQLELGSGDDHDDEPIPTGATQLANIQHAPISEGEEGQHEVPAAGHRRRRHRHRGGARAAETGAAAGALAEEAPAAPRGTWHTAVARPRRAPEVWPPACTTAMLRNIPNRYLAEELLAELLAKGFESTFDFLYLPIDFRTKRNRGYAFINFHTAMQANNFVKEFDKERFTRYATQKILEITPAVIQGLDQNLVRYCKKGSQRIKNSWFRPMVFQPEGEVDQEGAGEASVAEAAATIEVRVRRGTAAVVRPNPRQVG